MKRAVGWICLGIIGFYLFFSVAEPMFAFWPQKISNFFLISGWKPLKASNTVATIVWEYRAYDTLGEESVLFSSVVGIFALGMGLVFKERKKK